MERHRKKETGFDFWLIAKMLCTAAIMIPTTWSRFQPMFADVHHLYLVHGLMKIGQWLPAYFKNLHNISGWRFYLAIAEIGILFLVAYVAASALQVLLSRLILKAGFRAEEAEESRMLHPDQEV